MFITKSRAGLRSGWPNDSLHCALNLALRYRIDTVKTGMTKKRATAGIASNECATNLGIEAKLWLTDTLHKNADVANYIPARILEYFLTQLAYAEGKSAGQFNTPRNMIRVLVEMLAHYGGRDYDRCCASVGKMCFSSFSSK